MRKSGLKLPIDDFKISPLVEGIVYRGRSGSWLFRCPLCNECVPRWWVVCQCGNETFQATRIGETIGLFCRVCETSSTIWTCPDCGRENPIESTNGKMKAQGCFVATAVYGDYQSPEVQYLSSFRDGVLMTSPAGRKFISYYYSYGPIFARCIAKSNSLRTLVRIIFLRPLIWGFRSIVRFNG